MPGFVWDWTRADVELRGRYLSTWSHLAMSGIALALHFAAWSVSLEFTSLAHSLLFVCTTPILLVIVTFIMWVFNKSEHPPTWIEVVGVLLGLAAAAGLAAEAAGVASVSSTATNGEFVRDPSLLGDFIATMGAAGMGVYLAVGAKLRQWLPLWLYVMPVTLVAGIFCGMLSILFEDITLGGTNANSIFGVFGDPVRFGLVIGAAFTAGILGHTMANLALSHVSPLVVSVMLLQEPLIGTILGYVAGAGGPPTTFTILAGFPLMFSAIIVTVGDRNAAPYKRCAAWCSEVYAKRSLDAGGFQVLQQSSGSVGVDVFEGLETELSKALNVHAQDDDDSAAGKMQVV